MTSSGGLEGKAYLVTGGGTGIGRAVAARLAADGAAVTICGRTESTLLDSVARIGPSLADGGSIHHVVADVTVEDDVKAAVDAAASPTGDLDGCVANAGGGGQLVRLAEQATEEFLRVLHMNLLGTFLCLKHSVPRMIAAGGGSFVGMSSIAGAVTHPFFGAYPVSKAGIESLVRNAADEYGEYGVRCNSVRPGFIATEIMTMLPTESSVYRSYLDNTPLPRLGEPEDVAAAVRFLVGDESSWITGITLPVDGGHALRRGPDFTEFAG
ncbi:MAG TPA: SDR family oxidoreductase [Mycobacteriales bacterium]|nr:SDR family oxidoreductase [Mycobacteriales bacterium]